MIKYCIMILCTVDRRMNIITWGKMAAKVIDLNALSIPELDHLKEQVDQVF